MNALHDNNFADEHRQQLSVWFCERCQSVHFRAGEVLLTFTREEFDELTRAVIEIYCAKFAAFSQEPKQQLIISEMVA